MVVTRQSEILIEVSKRFTIKEKKLSVVTIRIGQYQGIKYAKWSLTVKYNSISLRKTAEFGRNRRVLTNKEQEYYRVQWGLSTSTLYKGSIVATTRHKV